MSGHPQTVTIRRADNDQSTVESLADLLQDCVAGGASIGFMAPLSRSRAIEFWTAIFASSGRGERIVLLAEEPGSGEVVGTVQVVFAEHANQPHRADIAKMQVRRSSRRRGVGEALLRAAEAVAEEFGRTLLVLDTVTGSPAEQFYVRLGWKRCGVIPGYALWPDGGLCDTTVLYRQL